MRQNSQMKELLDLELRPLCPRTADLGQSLIVTGRGRLLDLDFLSLFAGKADVTTGVTNETELTDEGTT